MFHGRPHSMNGNAAASAVIFFCICNAIWTVVTRAYSLYPLCINHINNKTKLWFLQQLQNNCKEEHFLLLGLFFRQIGTWYDKWTPDTTPFVSLFAFAFFKCSQTSLSLNSSSSCIIKCTLNHYDKWLFVRRYWLMPLQTSAAKLGPIIESTEFYNFLLNTEPKRIPLPSLYKRDVVNLQRETFILMTEAPGFLQGTRILTVGFDRIFIQPSEIIP